MKYILGSVYPTAVLKIMLENNYLVILNLTERKQLTVYVLLVYDHGNNSMLSRIVFFIR